MGSNERNRDETLVPRKGKAAMDVDLVFKIAAVGILVSVLNQVLTRSGREEQATMTTLAGLIVVPHDGGAEDQRALRAGQDPLRAVMGHGYAGFGRGGGWWPPCLP